MPDVDYYAVLGIEKGASTDEVKAAYRRAVKAAHPDHGGTEGLFVLVQEAGDHLLDAGARAAYDSGASSVSASRNATSGTTTTVPAPAPADPWGGDWNDAVSHSPVAPPSFAQPWWQQPAPSAAPSKLRRRKKSVLDHGIRAADAPPPLTVLFARLAFLGFVAGFIALRVFALTPRSPVVLDRLGMAWTLLPVIGAACAAWAIRSITHEPSRYGGLHHAWMWLALNVVAAGFVIFVGTALLKHAF